MNMHKIRVLLVDDHAVVREGLTILLEQQEGILVVGEAQDGAVALQLFGALTPDIVMLDIMMPGPSVVEVITEMKRLSPGVKILVFTGHAEDSQVRDALVAGAIGYMFKDVLRDDLIMALREIAAGRAWLNPQAQRHMLNWVLRAPLLTESLTTRERSVLAFLSRGLSNKQIAVELELSEGTIKSHVGQILSKLGVADRTQAALLARKEGFDMPDVSRA